MSTLALGTVFCTLFLQEKNILVSFKSSTFLTHYKKALENRSLIQRVKFF